MYFATLMEVEPIYSACTSIIIIRVKNKKTVSEVSL